MCELQRNTADFAAAEEFLAQTEDFLVPVDTNKVFCQLGICPNTHRKCWPRLWKCKYSENMVHIAGMSRAAVDDARRQCRANNTCGIEPVGGEGGIIETPQRDDFLPQDIFNRQKERDQDVGYLRKYRILLVLVLIAVLCFSYKSGGIFSTPTSVW